MTRELNNASSAEDCSYPVVVIGTAFYMRELRGIAGHGEVARACTATLRFDPLAEPEWAVCVIVAGWLVGHLGIEDASRFASRYGGHARNCKAVILGQASEPWRMDLCLDLEL